MSVILNALRHRSVDRGSDQPSAARSQTLPGPLGYAPPAVRGLTARSLLLCAVAAVVIGFVGVAALIAVLSSATPPAVRAAVVPAPRPIVATSSVSRGTTTLERPASPDPAPVSSSVVASSIALPAASPAGAVPALPAQPALTASAAPAAPITRAIPTRVPDAPRGTTSSSPPASAPVAQRSEPAAAPANPIEDHFELALYYQRIGDFDGALIHYRALLEQNDGIAEIHNNLGLLYEEHGQHADAVTQFQRAIALDPRYVKAHNNLGVSLMRANVPTAAAAEFRVALQADPRNVESLVNLALLQKAAGRVADARDLLRRALTIDPRSAGSHYNLAIVADEGGDAAAAIEHYRAFLRFGTTIHADLVGRVRARLATLGG